MALLLVAAAACRGAEEPDPLAAIDSTSPSPTVSATSAPDTAPTYSDGGGPGNSGDSGNGPGGGSPGDGPGGANPDDGVGEGGEDAVPTPAPLQIAAAVSGPPPSPGCAARGTITMEGGEYPMEIVYQWFRIQPLGAGQLVPMPFGGPLTTTATEPGELAVQSPDFPATAAENRLQLRIHAPQPFATNVVTYPECAKLGLSG